MQQPSIHPSVFRFKKQNIFFQTIQTFVYLAHSFVLPLIETFQYSAPDRLRLPRAFLRATFEIVTFIGKYGDATPSIDILYIISNETKRQNTAYIKTTKIVGNNLNWVNLSSYKPRNDTFTKTPPPVLFTIA